jgi:hypothetical protein
LQFNAAEPTVWLTRQDGEDAREAFLHPVEEQDGALYSAFVAHFDPYGIPSWLEPIQQFVLYWRAWPRHGGDENIRWFEEGDDSRSEEIARWTLLRYDDPSTVGLLEVRRDRLMTFLSEFEYDLAIYYEHHKEVELEDGWRDEEREDNRFWRVWATDVGGEVRAMVRAVKFIERPERDEPEPLWDPRVRESIPMVIGANARGEPVRSTHPPTEFLTPVFFRDAVLERYYQDPHTYRVKTILSAGVANGRCRSRGPDAGRCKHGSAT